MASIVATNPNTQCRIRIDIPDMVEFTGIPEAPQKKKTQEILIVLEAMGVPVNMPSNEFI